MEGGHSEALTSCHSPVVGSCREIQPGSLDHLIIKPRLAASSSLRRSRSSRRIRARLCSRSVARSSSVSALLRNVHAQCEAVGLQADVVAAQVF